MAFSSRTSRFVSLALASAAIIVLAALSADAETIGKEAVLPLPADAFYGRFIVPLPTDGETARLNPPIFSWFYAPEYKLQDEGIYAFRFQVAEDKEFNKLVVDKVCSYNFYNTLKPFKAGTLYWRVGYIPMPKTLGAVADPNKVSEWNRVRSFTIAGDAVEWDRSMLADAAYTASKKHPRMLFTKDTLPALRKHLESDKYAKSLFEKLRQKARQGVAADWWRTKEGATQPAEAGGSMSTRLGRLCAAAFVWQVTGDEEILKSNPQEALARLADEFVRERICFRDPTRDDESNPWVMLSLSYDWLHETMTPDQRKTVVAALDKTCDWVMNHFWWRQGVGRSWNYQRERDKGIEPSTGEFLMNYGCGAKIGSSHEAEGFNKGFYCALANCGEPDAPWSRELFEVGVNYLIAKTYFSGNRDGGFGEGSHYVMSVLPQAVELSAIMNTMFPEAGLAKNPYFANTSRFLRYYLPVGLQQSPWGDSTEISTSRRFGAVGEALGMLAGDGLALKHTAEVGNNSTSETAFDLSLPAMFKTPEIRDDAQTAACYPLSGWAMANSLPPSSPNAVKDGVGIVFMCRPIGNYSHGGLFANGSLSIYAYGRMVTFGESRMSINGYNETSFAHNCVLVDGMGQAQKDHVGYYDSKTFFGRLCAFKQADDYVYFCGDTTSCYPSEKMSLSYYLNKTSKDLLSSRDLSYLQKARRHVLFMHKKYFVVYDELETDPAKPAQFTWVYHVVPQELKIDKGDTLALRYEAGWPAKKEAAGAHGPMVNVVHVADVANLEVLDTDSKDSYKNPFTGEIYAKSAKPLEEIEPAHHIWISNKDKKSKFHFMAVIYPVKPGEEEPKITRLDDSTVEVTCGADHDVVNFVEAGAKANPKATVAVDLEQLLKEDMRLLEETKKKYLGD